MPSLVEIAAIRKDALEPERKSVPKPTPAPPTATPKRPTVDINEMLRRHEEKQAKVVAIRNPNVPPPKPKRLAQIRNTLRRTAQQIGASETGTKASATAREAAAKVAANPRARKAAVVGGAAGLAALSALAAKKAPLGLKGPVAGTVAAGGAGLAALIAARRKFASLSQAKKTAVLGGGAAAAAGIGVHAIRNAIKARRAGQAAGGLLSAGGGAGAGRIRGGRAASGSVTAGRRRMFGAAVPDLARRRELEASGRRALPYLGAGVAGAYAEGLRREHSYAT